MCTLPTLQNISSLLVSLESHSISHMPIDLNLIQQFSRPVKGHVYSGKSNKNPHSRYFPLFEKFIERFNLVQCLHTVVEKQSKIKHCTYISNRA
jgi:hypothetical protein